MMIVACLSTWADNNVTVSYNGTTATVTVDDNVAQYLTVTQSGAHVSIAQSANVAEEITYTLSGMSTDGEFYMLGSFKATIQLSGLTLTNTTPVYSGAAIHIQNSKRINIKVMDGTTNTLTDAANGSQKGCLYVKGHAEFKQRGTLNIVGKTSHGIKAGEYISVKNATINVTSAVGDGISCNQYFLMESGTVNISGTGDDGIQCDLDGETSTGMTVDHEDEDSGNVYVSGGSITINSDAIAAKGIKCQGDTYISGDPVINVTTTGKGEWDSTDQETNAACGLSADGDINISGGTLTLKATGSGGKGMKCDNVLNISGGNITVSTTGGLYYNNGNGTENTNYTSNTDWVDNKYYSAAKGIKAGYKDEQGSTTICYGGINISGGSLYVTTSGRNAEGIESKNYLNVTGGETTIEAYDDGINAAQDLYVTDGYLYSRSSNNDGIDANGNVVIEGGLIYAIGAASPEVAIDANSEENKKFHFNGGVLIAIGGLESGSTLAQTCYQSSSVSSNTWYSMTYGGNVIAFLTPTVSSGGGGGGWNPGGGGPGGGNSSGLVVSAPSTPTLKSGVTVSNGTPVFYGPKSYLNATVNGGSNVSLSQYSSGGGSGSGSYTVTATANPTTGGTVTGAGTYSAHSLCTLTATANAGYTFVNWTRNGSVASTDPTYSFYVTENATCVANFAQGTYTVTATVNPSAGGIVRGTGTYNEGSNVTLIAVANDGYEFLNWTEHGTVVSPQATYTFVITSNRNLVANFEEIIIEGPNLSVEAYTPEAAPVNQETGLSLTLKNVGTESTSGITTVSLTCDDNRLNITDGIAEFNTLSSGSTVTLQEAFSFIIAEGIEDGTQFQINVEMVCGTETWTDEITVTAQQAILTYQSMEWDGSFAPGETFTLTAKFKNEGHYQATNAVAIMTSSSDYVTVSNSPINLGVIAEGEEVSCEFNVTIAANCPESEMISVTFTMTADGDLMAQGNETLKNTCNMVFELHDSYSGNDGWNGATLTVSFDDGTASQSLTINSGSNFATQTIEIGNGTHVTLTWTKGNYDNECSFVVKYEEGDLVIYEMATNSNPSAGVLYEFDCNCAAATAVFNITATSSNASFGTVSGGGEFSYGESCTVTATPADGYMFAGWTENGAVVSGANPYTFSVTNDHNLVASFVQSIEIGENTTTNNYLPSYNYYKYTLSQQIYTADEIGIAGTINSIAFYNGGAEKTRTYDFYLMATTKSSFSSETDWITVSASDKVFSGEVTMTANAWTSVTFTTPFEYDGTSNLVLVADDNSNGYSYSPHMACSVYNSNANQAIYVYSDNTNYSPMSPPTNYSGYSEYHGVLSVKNHILLGITPVDSEYHFVAEGNWSNVANWQGGALPTAEDEVFIDAPCSLDMDAEVANLTVSAGQSLTLQSGKMLTVTGTLTNTVNTGLIIADGAQLIASGSVNGTMKKSIGGYNSLGGWQLISAPVNGVRPSLVANMLSNSYDLYYYDQSQPLEWINYKSGIFSLASGKGYLYANSNSIVLSFAGLLNNHNGAVTLDYVSEAEAPGWNLVGNPYPCNAYLAEQRPFYVMNGAGNEIIASETQVISPMQVVFVVTSNPNGETIHFIKASTGSKSQVVINLLGGNSTDSVIDRAIINFDGGSTLEKLMFNEGGTKVYIAEDGHDYAVVARNDENSTPISFKASQDGIYTFSVDIQNLDVDYLHLIDNETGADIDLLQNPTYTFKATTADHANRFKVVYEPSKGN